MAYYSVLDVTPSTNEWIPDYLASVNQVMAQHGGKYLARTSSHERLEGEAGDNPGLRIIIEWPNKEAAMAFMNDANYAPHLKARTAGSVSNHYLIEGKDEYA